MIDLPLMARLLDGLADDAALILLGDVDQLASVEAGHVLASIGARGEAANRYSAAAAADLRALTGFTVPRTDAPLPLGDAFVELQHSHRFGGASGIGRLARAIRAGDADAAVGVLREGGGDVAWHDAAAAAPPPAWFAQHRALAAAASPQDALAAAARFRILTALRAGPSGCVAINRVLESELGDAAGWYHGRLVMITANDYRHGLFNGDVGIAWRAADGRLEVWFAGEREALRAFAPYTLPAHEPAFATTVHKSQGSEFDEVAIVLPDAPSRVLGRELLYTAVTRARSRAVVHGPEAVVRAAVARRIERWSGLADRLREEARR
jgi:exodeoxyribonuclease V alpha subunit